MHRIQLGNHSLAPLAGKSRVREENPHNCEKKWVAYPKLDTHRLRMPPALQCTKDHNGNSSSESEAVADEGLTSMADVSAIMNDNMGSEIDDLSSIPESMSERGEEEEEDGSVSAPSHAHGTVSDAS